MPLVTTRELVAAAQDRTRAVGAFNVITLEHAEAIARGAEAAGHPAILQISENCIRFRGGDPAAISAAAADVARHSAAPLALHLDHVTDSALLETAAACPFSSVMYDASSMGFDDNVRQTRHAVRWARERGWWVEGELGAVGGKGGAHAPGARTAPDEAHRFVRLTEVDALAVAVGSTHAMVAQEAQLDLDLVARLRAAVPVPLVLHGSSGVPDEQLVGAIRAGIVKVNVGTALNVAMTGTIRAQLAAEPTGVDPRSYLSAARDAMAGVVARLLGLLAG